MTTSNTAEQKSVIGKKELRSIFLRSLSLEYSWNYERQQNMGYCFAMLPAIKKIYQKKEDQIAAAKRHMEFFNTTPYISTAVFGISTAMEESNARNEDFDTSSINNVKVALNGTNYSRYWRFYVLGNASSNCNRNRYISCHARWYPEDHFYSGLYSTCRHLQFDIFA